ncbi:hypothetical protein [Halobacteriovorax sp. YZS-1-1]|uniref:hypothetical protein n=1 Tax=unclassified Halobacteriovorax TaxID=2639665 RepID=UPI00399BD828
MKKFIPVLALIISFKSFASIEVRPSCYLSDNEEILYMDMFPWNQTRAEMEENSWAIYNSGKRMDNRVFFEDDKFLMPFKASGGKTQYARVPEVFIKSLVSQIEYALDNDYVDFINFSDMGHSHFFIPNEFYNGELSKYSYAKEKAKFFETLMNEKSVLSLYHTAEQMKFFEKRGDEFPLADRYIQKRFYTRNFVAKNDGSRNGKILFNLDASGQATSTYRPDEYRYWGSGISFNATKNGCFSFKKNGQVFYFDMSADDVGYNMPNGY